MQELPRYSSFFDAVLVRRVDHGRVDQHVVVDELGRTGRVREDAADRAGHEVDVLGAVRLEPVVDRRLVAQVELLARRGEDLDVRVALEAADERRADEPAVAGDEDARRPFHVADRLSVHLGRRAS